MFKNVKRKKLLGIFFIVVAIIITLFTISNTKKYNLDKVENKKKLEKSISSDATPGKPDKVENEKKEEKKEDKYQHTDSTITLSGIPEDVLLLIDGKEAELLEAIQIWANEYGYRFEEKAFFEGNVTINYNENTVSISFYLKNENYTKFDVIYNKKTNAFSVEPW